MKIKRTSMLSGKESEMDLNVTEDQMSRFLRRRENGEYIQNIFPNLNAAEREFIVSGITAKEWDEAFKKD